MKTFFMLFASTCIILTHSACAVPNNEPNDEFVGIPSKDPSQGDPKDPSQGTKPQSIGFYSNGKLQSPDQMPDDGFGFVKLFQPRNRAFASYDMIYILSQAADILQRSFPSSDRIQIGDISQEKGGYISGHSSHQNGLDVDVAFIRKNQTEQSPQDTRGFLEKFVAGGKITDNFDVERNWAFSKILISLGRVQRIFVNQAVKNAFCDYAKKNGEYEKEAETLRRLRPWDGHEDHFHIRITCPLNSHSCKSQDDVPEKTGC